MKLVFEKHIMWPRLGGILLGLVLIQQALCGNSFSACDGSYTPTNCCMQTDVTSDPVGQYPKYIQGTSASAGGSYEGCGFQCVTVSPGEGGGSGHNWAVSFPGRSGLISGQVSYEAYLQQTLEFGCPYSRFATNTFSVLKDVAPPVLTIEYPAAGAIVKVEDNFRGQITDDYQLGALTLGTFQYDFIGATGRSIHDDNGAGILYYPDIFTSSPWSAPVGATGMCLGPLLQNATFYASDSVGNISMTIRQLYVDCSSPTITITNPVAAGLGMTWSDPDNPVISGTAADDVGIDKIWLTIKDELGKRWWDGGEWVAGIATVDAIKESGTTTVSWRYDGLAKEVMRSGIFTITAYVLDKVQRDGKTIVTGKSKKKYNLGEKEFAEVSMHVQDVSNIGGAAEDPYSFTSHFDENTIRVTAKISPDRLAGILDNYVMWSVGGTNSYSGKPDTPHGGNPSTFFVEIPPVIAVSSGRPVAMGYDVFPKIEYDYEDEHFTYYSPDHGNITQNNLDTLRQEYIDMGTGYYLYANDFDTDPPAFPGLLVSPGFETSKHQWHILRFLNSRATALNDAVMDEYDVTLNPSSGYRCPIGNHVKKVGGEYNSNHMLGRALDYSQIGSNSSEENWDVWRVSQDNGATEYLLYDQRNCRVNNRDLSSYTEFMLPLTLKVKCPNSDKEITEKVTSYIHGHAAW